MDAQTASPLRRLLRDSSQHHCIDQWSNCLHTMAYLKKFCTIGSHYSHECCGDVLYLERKKIKPLLIVKKPKTRPACGSAKNALLLLYLKRLLPIFNVAGPDFDRS